MKKTKKMKGITIPDVTGARAIEMLDAMKRVADMYQKDAKEDAKEDATVIRWNHDSGGISAALGLSKPQTRKIYLGALRKIGEVIKGTKSTQGRNVDDYPTSLDTEIIVEAIETMTHPQRCVVIAECLYGNGIRKALEDAEVFRKNPGQVRCRIAK